MRMLRRVTGMMLKTHACGAADQVRWSEVTFTRPRTNKRTSSTSGARRLVEIKWTSFVGPDLLLSLHRAPYKCTGLRTARRSTTPC